MKMKLSTRFRVWRRSHPDMAPDQIMGEIDIDQPLPLRDLITSYIAGFYRRGWAIEDLARELEVTPPMLYRHLKRANELIPIDERLPAHEAGQQRPRGPVRRLMLGGVMPPEER